mgnify:CR=1 FL=1
MQADWLWKGGVRGAVGGVGVGGVGDNRSDCLYHRLLNSNLILLAPPLSLWAVTNDALN